MLRLLVWRPYFENHWLGAFLLNTKILPKGNFGEQCLLHLVTYYYIIVERWKTLNKNVYAWGICFPVSTEKQRRDSRPHQLGLLNERDLDGDLWLGKMISSN